MGIDLKLEILEILEIFSTFILNQQIAIKPFYERDDMDELKKKTRQFYFIFLFSLWAKGGCIYSSNDEFESILPTF